MKKIYIDCVGVDNKLHICEPHLNITKCGVVVRNKKLSKSDKEKYNCYECTY